MLCLPASLIHFIDIVIGVICSSILIIIVNDFVSFKLCRKQFFIYSVKSWNAETRGKYVVVYKTACI